MKKGNLRKLFSVIIAIMMVVTIVPNLSFAAENPTANWYNFRNNQENNGVSISKTPIEKEKTVLRFAEMYGGGGYENSPTPPLIIGDKLYFAAKNVVIEADKKTGKELRRSQPLITNVGYATNSMIYVDGILFVQVENGAIQAVDLATLKPLWHTKAVASHQTMSPIATAKVNGKNYVYTGTWTSETTDGEFFAVAVDEEGLSGNENDLGGKLKDTAWIFQPSGADSDENPELTFDPYLKDNIGNPDENPNRGFYWAGAYATDKFVIVGSDNGSGDESEETARLYALDPTTGQVLDVLGGIRGDIRSSIVYKDGYVFFTTKAGFIYKVMVSENGEFSNDSRVQIGAGSSSTPIIYKDRIYLSVKGEGSAFASNGGHGIAVLSNSDELNDGSVIYTVNTPGYNQGAILLSSAYENEDFDKNGEADGRVYLYFTLNTTPGSVYYFYDDKNTTSYNNSGKYLYTPTQEQEQYCISPVIADTDGTIFFKNDSSRIFALEENKADLENISIVTNENKEAALKTSFNKETLDYEAEVSSKSTAVKLDLTYDEEKLDKVEISVNGEEAVAYNRDTLYPLSGNSTPISIKVVSGTVEKEYNLVINKVILPEDEMERRRIEKPVSTKNIAVTALMVKATDLSLEAIEQENLPEQIKQAIREKEEDIEAFVLGSEISLVNGNHEGPYDVEFLLGAEKEGRKVLVHHLKNNAVETFEKSVMDGKVIVRTDGLSPFAVSLLKNTEDDKLATLTEKKKTEKTNLAAYKNREAYREMEAGLLDKILEKAATDIDNAKTAEDIDGIVVSVKVELDKLKTDAVYKAEEQAKSNEMDRYIKKLLEDNKESFLTPEYLEGKGDKAKAYLDIKEELMATLGIFRVELNKEPLDLARLEEIKNLIVEETNKLVLEADKLRDEDVSDNNDSEQINPSNPKDTSTGSNMYVDKEKAQKSKKDKSKPKKTVKTGDYSVNHFALMSVMIMTLGLSLFLRKKYER